MVFVVAHSVVCTDECKSRVRCAAGAFCVIFEDFPRSYSHQFGSVTVGGSSF